MARQLVGVVLGSACLRVFGMGLGLLVGVQLARYLGVEQMGVYGFVMAAVTLSVAVAMFGVPALVNRHGIRTPLSG